MQNFSLPHDHGKSDSVEHLMERLGDEERFSRASELFDLLSDTARVRIFWLLSHREECVINISALLNMSSPAVCHHLAKLKDRSVIESRRDGKEVYYRTADTESARLLHATIEKIMEIECPSSDHTHAHSNEEIISEIHDHMLTHMNERITIEKLSKSFHINPTTLKSEFKKKYGDSIASHVNEHRMERAAELLKNTDKSIGDIASEVGFSGQSRFTSAFKKHFGKTPSEYR